MILLCSSVHYTQIYIHKKRNDISWDILYRGDKEGEQFLVLKIAHLAK